MKRCLTIINNSAGKSKRISFEKVEKCLGDSYSYTRFSLPEDGEYCLDGYDAVAVAGGDGTLSSLLEKAYDRPIDVFYFPSGTLNDRASSCRYSHTASECPCESGATSRKSAVTVGRFCTSEAGSEPSKTSDGRPSTQDGSGVFSYVLAAGSFTPIGYMADVGAKKRLGVLAYVLQILKQYKIHRIPAKIRCGNSVYEGDFTLIMAIKSPRCFGFSFNKAFDPESISGHLIAIRSPKHGGPAGLIEMFFPFFRVFFMGLKREREGKIIFKKIYSCDIIQKEAEVYCRDGERCECPQGKLSVNFVKSLCNFAVIDKYR